MSSRGVRAPARGGGGLARAARGACGRRRRRRTVRPAAATGRREGPRPKAVAGAGSSEDPRAVLGGARTLDALAQGFARFQGDAAGAAKAAAQRLTQGEGEAGAPTRTGCVVLMRHGESMFNSLNLFTGDADVPLSEEGVMEALAGGRAFDTVPFDLIVCSRLNRSRQTAMLALTQTKTGQVPIHVRGGIGGVRREGDSNRRRLRASAIEAMQNASCPLLPLYSEPALNERCYGELQGLNKSEAAEAFGAHQVGVWRRSSSVRPPGGESMRDTAERAVGFFVSEIEPRVMMGQSVLISAHGNSLRCLIAHILRLTEDEALRLNVVTAQPYMFSYQGQEEDTGRVNFSLESSMSSEQWPPHMDDESPSWQIDRKWAHGPTSTWKPPGKGEKSAQVDVLNGF